MAGKEILGNTSAPAAGETRSASNTNTTLAKVPHTLPIFIYPTIPSSNAEQASSKTNANNGNNSNSIHSYAGSTVGNPL